MILIAIAHLVIWRRIRVVSGLLGAVAGRGLAPALLGRWRDRIRRAEDHVHALYPRDPRRLLRVAVWELSFHVLAVIEIYLVLSLISPAAPTVLDAVVFESVNRFIAVVFKVVPMRIGVDEAGTAIFAELLAFGTGYVQGHRRGTDAAPWRPERVNLGSGRDYKPGWLNLDILDRAEPDLVLDLAQPVALPIERPTRFGGTVRLEPGSVQRLFASNVLEHVPDLTRLMGNALALLADGGLFEIEVPYEKAPTAWQDPTHVRALNENSWLYYTDWFWYLGWFEHRFEIATAGWLDAKLRPSAQADAAFMRVTLRKIQTSPRERTLARAMRADFGGLPDDDDSLRPAATVDAAGIVDPVAA
jgi:hypothetical protein